MKKILSMFLALCMVLTMTPVSLVAEEIHTTVGGSREIISFAPLTETEKAVSLGTSIEDLELPETLSTTVRTATIAHENPAQDSSSPGQGTTADDSVAATTSSAIGIEISEAKEAGETTDPEWQEGTVDIPVIWTSPEYDMDTEGEYVFTPVIEGYTVSAALPGIKVTVGDMPPVAPAMMALLTSSPYKIWVGSTQVTDANKDNITGTGITGTVTYNSDTNTLTLNGANITANYSNDNGTYGIYANQALNIVLEGDNRVTALSSYEKGSTAISIANNPLVIDGSGSLTAAGGNVSGFINYGSFGIAANGLTINSGTVVAEAGTVHAFGNLSYGIFSSGALKFNGGSITAAGNDRSINKAPDLGGYTDLQVTASENISGTPVLPYHEMSIANYKYIKFESAVITDDAQNTDTGTSYFTLQEAVNAVEDGQTIQLLKNINLTTTVTIANGNQKSFTLDLNGKILDGGSSKAIAHKGTGALAIKGSGTVQNNSSSFATGAISNESTGSIIISDGIVQSNETGIFNLTTGTIIVSGGTVSGRRGIFNNSGGYVNVSGGTVQSTGDDGNAIYTNEGGNITISGDAHITSANVKADNGAISLWFSNDLRPITLKIYGGTIENTAGGNGISKRGKSSGELIANISIPNGKSALIKGGGHAMNFAPTLVRATATASENISGTPVADYNGADIQSYKYLKFDPGPDATITNLNLTNKLTPPTTGETPEIAITHEQYTGTIIWSDNPTIFLGSTVYTATVTLIAKDGYTFSGVAENAFSYNGATSVTNSGGSGQSLTVTIMFPKTMAKELHSIAITTPPTKTTYCYGETFDKTGMIMKASYDDGTTDENFTDYRVDKTEPLTLSDNLITLTANGTNIKTTQAITVLKRIFTVTVTNGTGSGNYAEGTIVAITANDRSGYTFTGWSGGGVTFANAAAKTTAFTMPAKAVTVTPNYRKNSSDGGGSGGDGSSSNDSSSPVIVTPPAPDKPNSPTQGEIKVPGTVDSKGNVTVSITDKTVIHAFEKALAQAKKNGNEQNGITVVLRVDTGSKAGSHAIVNLPKIVQDTIISKKIVNTVVVVNHPDIRIGMDLATVQEINKQAKSDVNITATRTDNGKLSSDAKKVIGGRPVFDLKVSYGSGQVVQNFGPGSVSVSIPYTLGANEEAGNLQAVYVDEKGKVHWLVSSVYDSVEQVLRFDTSHFSTYGIGYKQTNTAFPDIAGHWAKEDIEFVVSRGLFSGTSADTFSPNTAMTRGMFVTALGRQANADVSSYAYYMDYIEGASKNGIVNGTSNGKFAPDQSITREQMAVIMQNYAEVMGFTLPKVHGENTFADSTKISAYAKDAVRQMQRAGVISGKKVNLFDPQGTATRAEVSAVLRRFVELVISSDTHVGLDEK